MEFTSLNFLFNDETLQQQVEEFFNKNVVEFFSGESSGTVRVGWIDAKAIANPNGSYRYVFKRLANHLSVISTDYERQHLWQISNHLFEKSNGKTIAFLVNRIKELLRELDAESSNNNMWNSVYYMNYRDS